MTMFSQLCSTEFLFCRGRVDQVPAEVKELNFAVQLVKGEHTKPWHTKRE